PLSALRQNRSSVLSQPARENRTAPLGGRWPARRATGGCRPEDCAPDADGGSDQDGPMSCGQAGVRCGDCMPCPGTGAGAGVALLYLNEHDDAAVTREAAEREGRRAITISGDVRDREFCLDAVERVAQAFGKLDTLVNNAAFQVHESRFEELTVEHFDQALK